MGGVGDGCCLFLDFVGVVFWGEWDKYIVLNDKRQHRFRASVCMFSMNVMANVNIHLN